jgi:hypothetical protein
MSDKINTIDFLVKTSDGFFEATLSVPVIYSAEAKERAMADWLKIIQITPDTRAALDAILQAERDKTLDEAANWHIKAAQNCLWDGCEKDADNHFAYARAILALKGTRHD